MKHTKRKRKLETSKWILYYCEVLTGLVTCGTIMVAIVTRDASPLEYLIPTAFGLTGVSHGFYYWKAKSENLHKYGLDEKISNEDNNI